VIRNDWELQTSGEDRVPERPQVLCWRERIRFPCMVGCMDATRSSLWVR